MEQDIVMKSLLYWSNAREDNRRGRYIITRSLSELYKRFTKPLKGFSVWLFLGITGVSANFSKQPSGFFKAYPCTLAATVTFANPKGWLTY